MPWSRWLPHYTDTNYTVHSIKFLCHRWQEHWALTSYTPIGAKHEQCSVKDKGTIINVPPYIIGCNYSSFFADAYWIEDYSSRQGSLWDSAFTYMCHSWFMVQCPALHRCLWLLYHCLNMNPDADFFQQANYKVSDVIVSTIDQASIVVSSSSSKLDLIFSLTTFF